MTKERRGGLRDDFDYEVFCLGVLHYLTVEKMMVFMDLSGKIYLYQEPDISDINTNATHVEIYDENLQKKRTEVVPGRMYGMLQASSDTEPYWYGMEEIYVMQETLSVIYVQ